MKSQNKKIGDGARRHAPAAKDSRAKPAGSRRRISESEARSLGLDLANDPVLLVKRGKEKTCRFYYSKENKIIYEKVEPSTGSGAGYYILAAPDARAEMFPGPGERITIISPLVERVIPGFPYSDIVLGMMLDF